MSVPLDIWECSLGRMDLEEGRVLNRDVTPSPETAISTMGIDVGCVKINCNSGRILSPLWRLATLIFLCGELPFIGCFQEETG